MGVRLIHTSDWHLGHHLHGVSREREHAAFLAWLVDLCDAEAVDAVVITGDVFDGSNPPASAQAAYYGFLARLAARRPGVQVVVIGGNHDSPSRLEAPAPLLDALRVRVIGALPRNAAGIAWDRCVVDLGGAWLLAVPFLRAADLTDPERSEGGVGALPASPVGRGRSPLGNDVKARYAEGIAEARARCGDAPLVVTGHLNVSGAEPSTLSERRVVIGGSEAVAADLFPPDLAYVALGHLHKAQRVGGREHVRYAGSPIPLAMTEADYRHQVVVVEIGGVIAIREVPRTVELVRIPKRGAAPLDEVLAAIEALPDLGLDDDPDVRPLLEVAVLLTRPEPQLRVRLDHAMTHKRAHLVRFTTARAGTGAALGDLTVDVALADLSPREVLLQRWRRDHQGDPSAALLAAFDALVARVQA